MDIWEQFVRMSILVGGVCILAAIGTSLFEAIIPLTLGAAVIYGLYHVSVGLSR